MNTAPPQQFPGTVKNSTTGQPLLLRLWWVIPCLAACVFTAFYLSVHTIGQDEVWSFPVIHLPFPKLWAHVNSPGSIDVHPVGMYAAGRVAYLVFGSPRWMPVLPLIIWFAGVIVFVVSARPLIRRPWALWVFAALAFMHPQALMWSPAFRWYPYWSGLGLILISITLLRPGDRLPSIKLCLLAGLVGAVLVYFSYVTAMLAACIAVAWLVRYGTSRASLARLAVVLTLGALLSAPQIIPFFTAHLKGLRGQQASMLVCALRLAHGLSIGEAILPWRPAGVCLLLGFLLPAWVAVAWRWFRRPAWLGDPARRAELALLVVFLGLVCLGVASKLSWKTRSFLLLAPISALFLTLGCQTIRWRAWPALTILATAVWIATGGYNLLTRTGTAKIGVNMRPDDVVNKICELAQGRPVLVFTYDGVLPYELNTLRIERGQPVMVCSSFPDLVRQIPSGLQGDYQSPALVFVVETFMDLTSQKEQEVRQTMKQVRSGLSQESLLQLDYDPDHRIKSHFYRTQLPEYLFVIHYGPPAQGADYREIIRTFEQLKVP